MVNKLSIGKNLYFGPHNYITMLFTDYIFAILLGRGLLHLDQQFHNLIYVTKKNNNFYYYTTNKEF
jgi:hypothetical protein